MFSFKQSLAATACLTMLAACAVGPDYKRPSVETPTAFKEVGDWKVAQPKDEAPRGNWWELFNDAQLHELEAQLNASNQNIRVAEARYRQAHALIQSARAGFYPTLSANASAVKTQSGARALATGSDTSLASISHDPTTTYDATLSASWELDVWGRVRRTLESDVASAQASAADLAAARMSAQAELADDYFQLQITDAQVRLLNDTVAAYDKSLQLTMNRYAVGVATRSDVVQAQTQLKSAQAQALDLEAQRAQLEHAIAVLVGKAPAELSITSRDTVAALPSIPATLPSAVLEQRPDIAAAERRVAAANAQIGVAKAAYFPQLTLSGSGGYRSNTVADWFAMPSRFWSLGSELAATLFDAGARHAQSQRSIAAYDESVATYRQTVLTVFQEVEDNLATLRILEQEAQVEDEAVKLARDSVTLVTNQYKAGTVSYLNVVTVQATQFANERTALSILGRRLTASVALVKAVGGSWNEVK